MSSDSISGSSRDLSPDIEVQKVFSSAKEERCSSQKSTPKISPTSGETRRSPSGDREGTDTPKFLEFWQDGSRRSAFSPYTRVHEQWPSTVLTNLQRGNVKTQTPSVLPERSIHQLAAQGELFPDGNANLDEPDSNGFTPLLWASAYGQLPTVSMLLERNSDCTACGSHGENALLLSSCNGHNEIVKLLIGQDMDVNQTDFNGNTALIYAAFNNHGQCAEELLKHGADITMENLQGDTAYAVAVARGSKQVQLLMEKHMLEFFEHS